MSTRERALPRGRRGGLATLVALIVLVAAVLGAIAAIQIHSGRDSTVLGSVEWVTERLRTRDWTDIGVLVAGIACAAVGLLLVLAGLFPARRPQLRLADPDAHTIAGITREGLARDLTAAATAVDGVAGAKTSVRRRGVRVWATAALRDDAGLRESVETAVSQRLAALQPVRPLAVSVRVRPGGR